MEFLIIFGIVIVPLFAIGLFAVYKMRQERAKEQALQETHS